MITEQRIVNRTWFDKSDFDEWSLNKELLRGLDLANQIVGVLSRFLQNSITLMAGIEAIYYQVMVSELEQTFKYLWQDDHNMAEI